MGPSLQSFVSELEEYEKLIADTSKPFGRWRKHTHFFTLAEKRKASYIQNFEFPNDEETIRNALLFIKEQMHLLASKRSNKRVVYWAQLWTDKAEELNNRAGGWGQRSESAAIYKDIVQYNKKIKRPAKIKIAFFSAIFVLTILFAFSIAFMVKSKDQIIRVRNYVFSIPYYWDEWNRRMDIREFHAETGGKSAVLYIFSNIEYEDVTIEKLRAENDEMVSTIESWADNCKVFKFEEVQSDYGVEGILYSYTFTIEYQGIEYASSGECFCFPSVEDSRCFLVCLATTDNTDFDYEEDFMEVLASIMHN